MTQAWADARASRKQARLPVRRRQAPTARADMKELLGGKGANLAEMASLGLPVPPGFTITTEVCTAYYANGRKLPDGLEAARSRRRWPHVGRTVGATFGDADAPLLVSVRSGARASMPGMMDTILNLGLNDETVKGLAAKLGQRALRLRQLPPLHPDVRRRRAGRRSRRVRGHPREPQEPQRPLARHRARRRRLARDHRRVQGGGGARDRQAVPAGHRRAAVGRHRRRVRLLAERARQDLSPPARHPRQLGHGRQRAGHGVRQPGRHLGHRRRLHAQPLDRRARDLRRVPDQRAGRGRGRRHPHAAAADRGRAQGGGREAPVARGADARAPSRARAASSTRSRRTTATCRTSSSPSRRASCGCCRRAPASARRKAALKIAVDLVAEGADRRPRRRCCASTPARLDQLLHPTIDPDAEKARGRDRPAGLAGRRLRRDRVRRRRGRGAQGARAAR